MYRRKRAPRRRSRRVKTRRSSLGRRKLLGKRWRPGGTTARLFGAAAAAASNYVSQSRTSTKQLRRRKRSTVLNSSMQELTRSKRKISTKRYSLNKIVNCIADKRIERFQGITNFDTNTGYWFLGNNKEANGVVNMPLAIFNLGCLNQPTLGVFPSVMVGHGWTSELQTAAATVSSAQGQQPDGTALSAYWQIEHNDKFSSTHDSAIIDWVSVKLNLYGARDRTTRFTVTFFKVKDEDTDPGPAFVTPSWSTADPQYQNNIQAYERPYIYSNLQIDAADKKKGNWKIIKEYNYIVDPQTSTDLNTTTGKIHEANIFLRLNEKMTYLYPEDVSAATIPHTAADGADYVNSNVYQMLHSNPRPLENIYMMVRAFAPIRTGTGYAARTAGNTPSMDFIVRRQMTLAE